MLYVYVGVGAREKAQKKMQTLKIQAVLERVLGDQATDDVIRGSVGTSLFGAKRVVFFEGVYSNTGLKPVLTALLPTIKESPDHFFIIEDKLLAPDKKKVSAFADEINEDGGGKVASAARPNTFAVADHFARHEKAQAWVAYRKALAEGESAEALHGILFWKVKDQLLKGVRDSKRDLRKTVGELAQLPQKARERGGDVEHALELFILNR